MIESLVCLAIIAILPGLMIPAVSQAREVGRRVTCRNDLRQLALATLNVESLHGRFSVGVSHKVELLPFRDKPRFVTISRSPQQAPMQTCGCSR